MAKVVSLAHFRATREREANALTVNVKGGTIITLDGKGLHQVLAPSTALALAEALNEARWRDGQWGVDGFVVRGEGAHVALETPWSLHRMTLVQARDLVLALCRAGHGLTRRNG